MKLEISLENEKERALKNAELIIKLVFKDGKERIFPSRTSNIRGEVSVDEFNIAIFKKTTLLKARKNQEVSQLDLCH